MKRKDRVLAPLREMSQVDDRGAGIIATGYVMEAPQVMTGAKDREAFARGLRPPKAPTAWSSGEWVFGHERRPRNGQQNVPSDIRRLSLYLVGESRRTLTDAEAV
jgi:hypothetical protein